MPLNRFYAPAHFAALDERADRARTDQAIARGRESARQAAAVVAHNEAFAARHKAQWPINLGGE
jgi:hypothetical protein